MVFTIEINGRKVTAKSGETILTVLNRNGIKVPTICHLSGFTPTGACRMCVVEVEGLPELTTSCSHPVEEWMRIHTHSPRVLKARKTLVELLLANHPDDCLYCDRSGSCELQKLAEDLNIRERKFRGRKPSIQIDRNCASIERDPAKCILCGRCIRVCDEVIGVSAIEIIGRGSKNAIGTSLNKGLNIKACVKCGQCIMVCPTGALKERNSYPAVIEALQNKDIYPVIQLSPAVLVSVAEDIGVKTGKDPLSLLKTALLRMGFKEVYDTSVGADILVMETAAALVNRVKNKEKIPLFTSCCPSWVSVVREFRPAFTGHLAAAESPMMITGTLIKKYFAEKNKTNPDKIFSVAVMPCTSKKAEIITESPSDYKNVDAVITTRELIRLFRLFGIDFTNLDNESPEPSYGLRGSSGKLFGTAGGAMESIIRTFYFQMTGQELPGTRVMEMRGQKNRKEFKLKIGKQTYGFAAVNGLLNAKILLDEIESGRNDLHMVEVMACLSGCINGGGQRFGSDEKTLKARAKALYDSDEEEMIRVAHKNPAVSTIYEEFLEAPLSEKSRTMIYRHSPTEQSI